MRREGGWMVDVHKGTGGGWRAGTFGVYRRVTLIFTYFLIIKIFSNFLNGKTKCLIVNK